jgi:hypothetical protein
MVEVKTWKRLVDVRECGFVSIEEEGADLFAEWDDLDPRVVPRISVLSKKIEELSDELAVVLRLAVSPGLDEAA